MELLGLLLAVIALVIAFIVQSRRVQVREYRRRNGAQVRAHSRRKPRRK